MPSTTAHLLLRCGLIKTRRSTHLPIYRMTRAKDAKAEPHWPQTGASVNGRGDLKATKGTRFSDLLEPIHAQRKHGRDAIISLFSSLLYSPFTDLRSQATPTLHDSLQN